MLGFAFVLTVLAVASSVIAWRERHLFWNDGASVCSALLWLGVLIIAGIHVQKHFGGY